MQEGILDISLEFSDGATVQLRDVDPAQYYLTVDTLDTRVIAFAPAAGSRDTRVVAVGRGEGELLTVSLELADDCHDKNEEPLATGTAFVRVEFNSSGGAGGPGEARPGRRNKKRRKEEEEKEAGMKSVNMGDLSEMFSNIALRDDISRVNSPPASPHQPGPQHRGPPNLAHSSPLEVGMYVLLAVFCIAIAIFMASCFVYASRHSEPGNNPLERKSQSVQNAHDWVWMHYATVFCTLLAIHFTGVVGAADAGQGQHHHGWQHGAVQQPAAAGGGQAAAHRGAAAARPAQAGTGVRLRQEAAPPPPSGRTGPVR